MAISTRPAATSGSKTQRPLLKLRRNPINSNDRRFFTEQLALLLETGNSMQSSLLALKQQTRKPAMIELIDQLLQDIERGQQLSSALKRHPNVFSPGYVNLIAASEEGGYLHQVLEQLLQMEEKREELRQTLFSALSYPVFLLVFALAVVVFVLVVVFPKFADLFELIADELPVTTVFLMATSRFIQHYWLFLLLGSVAVVSAFWWWSRGDRGREQIDRAKLHLPLIGGIFQKLYLVQSMRVLGSSIGNGVNIIDALHSARDVVDNRLYQRFMRQLERSVEQGHGIAAGFADVDFMPPLVGQMVGTGEESGNLARVLLRLSDHYERELAKQLSTLSRLAEPVMLLVMGGVVGLIVSSLILPIFKLSHAVG